MRGRTRWRSLSRASVPGSGPIFTRSGRKSRENHLAFPLVCRLLAYETRKRHDDSWRRPMQMTDKPRFVTVLAGVAEYYGRDLSEGVIGLYWQGLKQYDLRAVEKALWDHTQNPDSGQFMPKIADVTRNLQGRTTDQASIAWSKVDGAVRRVGPYQDVAFDDALIHRVIVDMGGWVKLGQITEKDWEFYGNQFRTRYQGYRLRGEIPEYPPVLVGISNSHNRKEGFKA